MGRALLKLAVVYLVAGIGLGLFMAMSHDHTAVAVHAHINLLGWASLALCGLIHLQFPDLQRHWLAKAHFGLHNAGLPVGMIALFFVLRGHAAVMPLVGIGSATAGLGVACFAILVLTQVRSAAR
jgi:hypothetical protein